MSTRAGELPAAAEPTWAPARRYLPAALRVLLLLLLVATLLLPQPSPPPTARGGAVVHLPTDARGVDSPLFDSLLVGTPPALVVRTSATAPTAGELEALAAVAARTPLLTALPAEPTLLRVSPPSRPRVQRAAAIPFRLRAAPGETVVVRLSDETGAVDSLRVVSGEDGTGAGAFRVRPTRAGWHEWSVAHGSRQRTTGAWVGEGEPPRVLVVAGPPGWETRFALRALEESGVEVELVQPLGRGLQVPGAISTLPTTPVALRRFDAVLLLAGASATTAQSRALDEYAARFGGGALEVSSAGSAAEVDGSRIHWSLPAELAPLPALEIRSAAQPLGELPAAAVAGARGAGGEPLLALEAPGRGRIATLALTETWRWRMEAGQVAEHREFWRSLVDWLASGVREARVVAIAEPLAPTGLPVSVRVFATDVQGRPEDLSAPPRLTVTRPDGSSDTLALRPDPRRPGVLEAALVPAAEGLHSFALDGDPAGAALRAVAADAAAAPDPWARLALLVDASGGEMLPRDSLDAAVRRRSAAPPESAPDPRRRASLLFGALLALATAEWSIRRLTGRT
ncbi:MAG: hypothetical protein H0W11_00895 [Gemmatimonadetes bacterium]|nr:hypothetical protein [Gemmatimonadota bacterium]